MKSIPINHNFCSRCGGRMMKQSRRSGNAPGWGQYLFWWACIFAGPDFRDHDSEFLGRSDSLGAR